MSSTRTLMSRIWVGELCIWTLSCLCNLLHAIPSLNGVVGRDAAFLLCLVMYVLSVIVSSSSALKLQLQSGSLAPGLSYDKDCSLNLSIIEAMAGSFKSAWDISSRAEGLGVIWNEVSFGEKLDIS